MRLDPDVEAGVGAFDLAANPFWRQPLDAMMDPEVRQITIKKCTQVGGTLLLVAAQLGLSELDPAPGMVLGPDELYLTELRDRIYADGSQSRTVADRIPRERDWNMRHVDLGTCRTYLAWAGSRQRLRGRPCKRVFRSEVDVYPFLRGVNPIKTSGERVGRFFDYLLYNESSPEGNPSLIDELYKDGNQSRWYCRCPDCRLYQELRFFPYRDGKRKGCGGIAGYVDGDSFLSPDEAREAAYYVCERGCKVDQSDKDDMVKSGIWVPTGQNVKKDGKLAGRPRKSKRHSSYHLWKIHMPTRTIGDIAAAYVEHKRDSALDAFWNNWLGLTRPGSTLVPEWQALGRKLQGTHDRGTVPAEAWFLTSGADVQDDGVYYVVRAWGDGGTSWLIDWGFLRRYAGAESIDDDDDDDSVALRSDLRQLDTAVLNRTFPVNGKNPLGKTSLRVRLAGIDAGNRPRDVHAFVRQRDERRVRAVRGDHKVKSSERFKLSVIERPQRGGRAYKGGLKLWRIFPDVYKTELIDRFNTSPNKIGSFLFCDGIMRAGSDYLRQLANIEPRYVIGPDGRKRKQFVVKNESIGNHYNDCEVYDFAIADMLLHELDLSWDASTWTFPRATKKRQPNAGEGDEQVQVAAREYM